MSLRDRVVVLDFDGVVWDSVGESFEQAWAAWRDIHGTPAVDYAEARTRFREARWQSKDGYDFCIAMALIAEGRSDVATMPAEQFRAYRESLARGEEADRFVQQFYARREKMRLEDFEGWCALQAPFPGVMEQIAQMRKEASGIAVATTKDEASARALLEHAGIHGMPIYGREVSLDKRDHMHAIAAHYAVPLQSLAFVDDLLENLHGVADLGVRLALAAWGYNTAEERAKAAAEGITVASLDTFAQQVGVLW